MHMIMIRAPGIFSNLQPADSVRALFQTFPALSKALRWQLCSHLTATSVPATTGKVLAASYSTRASKAVKGAMRCSASTWQHLPMASWVLARGAFGCASARYQHDRIRSDHTVVANCNLAQGSMQMRLLAAGLCQHAVAAMQQAGAAQHTIISPEHQKIHMSTPT